MPSSVRLGARPRMTQARLYSSPVRPCWAMTLGALAVTRGGSWGRILFLNPPPSRGRAFQPRHGQPICRSRRGGAHQRSRYAVEEAASVGAAEQLVGGVLGMRHQAEHRLRLVEDAGDVARRAVVVVGRRELARG